MSADVTRAEVCTAAVADGFRGDGEVLASAFGTVPAIALRLAKLTFEPDLLMTDGVAFLRADGTEQLFELAGPDPPNPSDGRVRVHGVLRGWDGDHARLEVEGSESLP